jgi:hypothetical protein
MEISTLEAKYKYKYSRFFKQLWEEGMIDWMNGRTSEFVDDETWENSVYPKIKSNPPVLLHTGGFDFEMFTPTEMLNFKFDEFWDIENINLSLLQKQRRVLFLPFIKILKQMVKVL